MAMETKNIAPMMQRIASVLGVIGVIFAVGALALPARGQASDKSADSKPAAARPRIEAAIANILELVRPNEDGVATVWDGNKFVQCRLLADLLRCEAAGALMQPTLATVLTPERQAALDQAGWLLDPSFGNYVQSFSAKLSAAEIADKVLAALTAGYDADLTDIGVSTAWVRRQACPPRVGFSQNLAGSINDSPEMASVVVTSCEYTASEPDTAPVATLDALIARYGQRVTGEIARLRINAESRVYVIFDAGIGYLQCAPESEPLGIYCEAESIAEWAALAAVLTPERLARLHALGFADPGRAPNYWQTYDVEKNSDEAIARSLLTVLFDVYGYRGAPALQVKTER